MMLLIFGWMLIGSAFIFAGWFRQGWRCRLPLSVYNAALMMALGMDLHASGMSLQTWARTAQILFEDRSFATNDPLFYIGAVLTVTGKTFFVWVASLGEGRTYSKPFWFAYLAALAAWALFVARWYLF